MKWSILAVGKLKSAAMADGVAEYRKRASRMRPIDMLEVPAAKAGTSKEATSAAMMKEGKALLAQCKPADHLIVLDRTGTARSSEDLSTHLTTLESKVRGRLLFAVGGAFGIDNAVKKRADEMLSFGPITLPHELARLVLAEQLYRALTIAQNLPYHH